MKLGSVLYSNLLMVGAIDLPAPVSLGFEPVSTEQVVPLSYLHRTGQLAALLHRRRPARVDIGSKIDKMDAALGLLARLDPHDRQSNIAAEGLA